MKLKTPLKPVVVGLLSSAILMGCNSDSEPTIELQPAKLEQQEQVEQKADYSKNDKVIFNALAVYGNDNEGEIQAIEVGQVFDVTLQTTLLSEFPTGMVLDVYVYPVDKLDDPDNIENFLRAEDAALLEGYVSNATEKGTHEIKIESVYTPSSLKEGNYNLIVKLAETDEDLKAVEDKTYQPVFVFAPVYVDPRPHTDLEFQDIYIEEGELALLTDGENIAEGDYTSEPVVILEADMINTGDEPITGQLEAFWVFEGQEYPMGVLGEVLKEGEQPSEEQNMEIAQKPSFTIRKTTKYVETVGVSLFADNALHTKMLAQAQDLSSGGEDQIHTFKLKWHSEQDGNNENNEKTIELPLIKLPNEQHNYDNQSSLVTKNGSDDDNSLSFSKLKDGKFYHLEKKLKKNFGNKDKFALTFESKSEGGIHILPSPGGSFSSETTVSSHVFKTENTIIKIEAEGGIHIPFEIPIKGKNRTFNHDNELSIEVTMLGSKVYEKKLPEEKEEDPTTLKLDDLPDDLKGDMTKIDDQLERVYENTTEKHSQPIKFGYEVKKEKSFLRKTFYPKGIPVEIEAGYSFETNPIAQVLPHGVGVKVQAKLPTKANLYAKGGVSIYVARAGLRVEGNMVEIPEELEIDGDDRNIGLEASAGIALAKKGGDTHLVYNLNANSYLAIKALRISFGIYAERRKAKWWGTYWKRYPTWWLWRSNWLLDYKRKVFEYEQKDKTIFNISKYLRAAGIEIPPVPKQTLGQLDSIDNYVEKINTTNH